MKVKELIEKLKCFNPKAEVYVIPPENSEGYLKIMDAEQEFSNVVSLGCDKIGEENEA